MEKFTYRLENLLHKKFHLYQELTNILKQEKEHILNMTVESLWDLAGRKKQIGSDIQKLRTSIIYLLDEKSLDHGMNLRIFSISKLINILPINNKLKSDLESVKIIINAEKRELKRLASENSKSIHEYLGVVNDVMSTITGSVQQKQYGFTGSSYGTVKPHSIINAEV